MRAVSLVRVWLYGVRGFIAMTVSLAIAFSWAVTGPPTNTEIDLVSDAVATKAEAFGAELEAAAIQLCPSLPEELRMLCGAPASPAEEAPAVEAPPKPPPVVELVAAEAPAEATPSVSEAQLLGGPAPRIRPERAQAPRTTTQRASARRPVTNQRAAPPRRASAQRRAPTARVVAQRPAPDRALGERIRAAQQAAQGDLSRAVIAAQRESQARPDPTPAVRRGDDSDTLHRELQRAAEAYRDRADEGDYYQAIEEERRARREERRRRRLEREREYEAAREREYREYYEEEAYPEAEEYPAEIW